MDNLLSIRLRAQNTELKCDRDYQINMGSDLFGSWYVNITFGRYNKWGTAKIKYCDNREGAYKLINYILKRRLGSVKRIGCPYQLVAFNGKDEITNAFNKETLQKFDWFSTSVAS